MRKEKIREKKNKKLIEEKRKCEGKKNKQFTIEKRRLARYVR